MIFGARVIMTGAVMLLMRKKKKKASKVRKTVGRKAVNLKRRVRQAWMGCFRRPTAVMSYGTGIQ